MSGKCKFLDCGYCYAPNGSGSNDLEGACVAPSKCPVLALQEDSGVRSSTPNAGRFNYVSVVGTDFADHINLFWGDEILALVPPPHSNEIKKVVDKRIQVKYGVHYEPDKTS